LRRDRSRDCWSSMAGTMFGIDDELTRDVTATPFVRQEGRVFVVVQGVDSGRFVRLRDEPVTFGSSPECDLVLRDKTVSRKHLTAVQDGAHVVVRDLGSRNGSYFEGARFSEIAIRYGAVVK